MIANIQFNLGRATYSFTIEEGKNEIEVLNRLITLGNPPTKCDECKSVDPEKFIFDTNKDKEGNIYVNVLCLTCRAKAKLGQYKTGGYFWHRFIKYQGQPGQPVKPTIDGAPNEEVNLDDLPF